MRVQFAKYFVIGIGGVILDIWSLHLLLFYFNPTISVVINQLFILNLVFFLNKRWAFGSQGITHQQMIRFYLVAGMNYVIAISWMWFFTNPVNFYPNLSKFVLSQSNYILLVRAANVALAVSWNFFLYKFFVYSDKSQPVNNLPG